MIFKDLLKKLNEKVPSGVVVENPDPQGLKAVKDAYSGRDDMSAALACNPNCIPRKPIITAFSQSLAFNGKHTFTIEGEMEPPLGTTGLKIHIPQRINVNAVDGGFDVNLDSRQPRPSIQATEAILGSVMGIPLENESEVLLETLKTIMESIKIIFPWVNPKHDITISMGSKRASCKVFLDMRHQIRVSVSGYDENEADGGEPINHILIAYYKKNSVIKQKSIRPLESDIIGILSVIRGVYPTVPENTQRLGAKLFQPYLYDGGSGITNHISTVFDPRGIQVVQDDVFYLNPRHTSILFPASIWKANPWRYAYNSRVFYRLMNQNTIIEYNGEDFPPLQEPPEFIGQD